MTSQTSDQGPEGGAAQTCAECGTRSPLGQSFCDGCGAVLSWTPDRERAATPGTAPAPAPKPAPAALSPEPAAEPASDAASRSRSDASTAATAASAAPAAVRAEDDTVPQPLAPAAAPLPPAAVPPRPAFPPAAAPPEPGTPMAGPPTGIAEPTKAPDTVPQPTLPQPTVPQPAVPQPTVSAAERARALLVPVADPAQPVASTPSVAPVLPGRPIAAPPQVQAPGAESGDEGGAPCPWCGTGNRPDRHFCRRCAMSMAGRSQDPARRPWWRRLPGLRERRVPWAGERPRLRRDLGRIATWVGWAALLTLVVYAALNVGTAVQAVSDHFAKRAPVSPDSSTASRSFPGHGPELAFDKINNTWWGPGISGDGAGQWIDAHFDQPTRLLNLVITSGESTQPSDLAKSALPHSIEAVVTTADGRTKSVFLTLDQVSGGQTRDFRVGSVTDVRFIIRSAYGAAPDKQVAIAEIEFFGPSSAGNS
ncbi:zinc ribbon domain-containing protein [Streptacidiphilus sp. EB129]|uniref:NADase-type glycan-binding domain-containing protein n=1 Tax=Streptacidiphilus sp. EB129 TaxID=3156262 RepID=UPI00351779FF